MKKKTLAVIAVTVIILSVAAFFISRQYTYITAAECGDDPTKAAELLLDKLLVRSCSPNIPERSRAVDYEIVKIEVSDSTALLTKMRQQKNYYEYGVEYNVQAAMSSSDLIAGNGEYGSDNWINGKTGFITFHKACGIYILENLGTGP